MAGFVCEKNGGLPHIYVRQPLFHTKHVVLAKLPHKLPPKANIKRDTVSHNVPQIRYNGGVGEIRTLAPVAQPNDLAIR